LIAVKDSYLNGSVGTPENLFDTSQLGHPWKVYVLNGIVHHFPYSFFPIAVLDIDAFPSIHRIIGFQVNWVLTNMVNGHKDPMGPKGDKAIEQDITFKNFTTEHYILP